MKNIFDFTYEKLVDYLVINGFKKFNVDQIFDWIYKKRVYDFNKMTNLSKKLILFLNDNFVNEFIKIEDIQRDDLTSKYLFMLSDGNYIEAVVMKHNYGNSLCVSSQVGCNMSCAFCESGRLKKVRNLFVYEMLQQLLLIEENDNIRIDNLVLMGIGEPFDNYDNIMDFVRLLTDSKAINLGQRRITISTCGLVPKIKKFSEENTQVNLAVSLHASNNSLRDRLMPINKAYPIDVLVSSIDEYISKTNRRVTIEYIMLDGINDMDVNAMELVKLFKDKLIYVNLIPYNETTNFSFKKSKKDQILKFYDILKKNNINVTVRREFGSKVDGACGQLRAKKESGKIC